MNKQLIDRKNPVLKFKLGKKIIKALGGTAFDTNNLMIYYTGRDGKRYKATLQANKKWIYSPIETMNFKLMPDFYTTPDGVVFNNNIGSVNSMYRTFNTLQKLAPRVLVARNYIKSKSTPVNNIFIKGYENRRGDLALGINGAHDVRGIQQELIKMGFLNDLYGADGKWGDNTEKAYTNYLNMLTQPLYQRDLNMSQEENGELRKFEPSRWDTIKLTPGKQYDNNWRNVKNLKFDLSSSRGMFKKGGLLISKSPVLRFKQGGIPKFQNPSGNLQLLTKINF